MMPSRSREPDREQLAVILEVLAIFTSLMNGGQFRTVHGPD